MLYHYCSKETFKSIIANRTIWLSDISKSNDSTELVSALLQAREKLQPSSTQFGKINELIEGIQTVLISWAFCMSEDGDLLSQWRGYANDGAGFSIGFDEGIMSINLEMIENTIGLELVKMNYGYEKAVDFDREEEILSLMIDCFHCKNAAFREEREHRLVAFNTKLNFFNVEFPSKLEYSKDCSYGCFKLDFGSNLVSHIELPLSLLGNPIREIVIGPKNKCSVIDVKSFLVSLGYISSLEDNALQIKKSIIPYV